MCMLNLQKPLRFCHFRFDIFKEYKNIKNLKTIKIKRLIFFILLGICIVLMHIDYVPCTIVFSYHRS